MLPTIRRRCALASAALLAGSALCLAAPPATADPTATPGAAASGKTLTVGTTASIDSLSPFLAERLLPTMLHRYMYDFLTNYDPKDDHPVGALATSWTTSSKRDWARSY